MNYTVQGIELSASPIEALQGWFAAHNWSHERLGDEEIVASTQGGWGPYELRGVWRDDDRVLQFLAMPEVRVPEGQRSVVYETIGMINEQLWLGHFELWSSNDAIVFRHAALLEGDSEVGFGIEYAQTLIEAAIDELDRFYPVFQFVLWGGKSPKDAIAAAMVDTQGEA